MSLNIKNAEAEYLAGEVGVLAGETKTAAVVTALRERRDRLIAQQRVSENTGMADDLLAIAGRIRSRIGSTALSTEHLYDSETGLPT